MKTAAKGSNLAESTAVTVGIAAPSSTEVSYVAPGTQPDHQSTKPVPFAELRFRHAGIGKSLLQKHARRVLGVKSSGGLSQLFRVVASHFGLTWTGSKSEGYLLLARFYDQTPEHQVPLKVSKSPTRKGMSYAPRTFTRTAKTYESSDEFLNSYQWRRLRMEVLIEQGRRCQCCGATPVDGRVMHVDHIKPRKLHPELALEKSNLQVLCDICNHGKGNWDQTDWRHEKTRLPDEAYAPMWSKLPN